MSLNPDTITATNPNIVEAVHQAGLGSNGDVIAATLAAAGFDELKDAQLSKVEDVLRSLASLITNEDDLRRATIREAALKKLDEIGISAPGRLLDAALEKEGNNKTHSLQGKPLLLREIDPHSEAVNGVEVLTDLCRVIRRYVVADNADIVAVALWCAHAPAIDAFAILAILKFFIAREGLRQVNGPHCFVFSPAAPVAVRQCEPGIYLSSD